MLNNSNLYGSEWLNVVFSNRNKNYGAYMLRIQSAGILIKSLFIAAPVFVFLFVGPAIYDKIFPKAIEPMETQVVMTIAEPIHELKKEEPKKEEIKKELPKAKPLKSKAKTVKFTDQIVVVDKDVADPPSAIDVSNSIISTVTQEGEIDKGNAQTPVSTAGGNGGAVTGSVNGNEIYNVSGVDAYPEFPGGMAAWSKFIQRNLRYPYAAQENGTQGKVFLSFVIEKDGSISDVTVMKGIGFGCDEEAVRVIKKSPKWKAGSQNNQAVRVRYTMPIGYMLN
jgi:protein TonB